MVEALFEVPSATPAPLPVPAEDKMVSCKPLMEHGQTSGLFGGSEVVVSQGGPSVEPNLKPMLIQHGMESSAVRPMQLESSGQQEQAMVIYAPASHSYLNTGHLAPQAPTPLLFPPPNPPQSGSSLPSQLTTPTPLLPPAVAPPTSLPVSQGEVLEEP